MGWDVLDDSAILETHFAANLLSMAARSLSESWLKSSSRECNVKWSGRGFPQVIFPNRSERMTHQVQILTWFGDVWGITLYLYPICPEIVQNYWTMSYKLSGF